MSFFFLLIGISIHYSWFYDESDIDPEHKAIVTLIFFGLAFIAWCVETIAKAIREKE